MTQGHLSTLMLSVVLADTDVYSQLLIKVSGDPLIIWDGPRASDRDLWAWTNWVKGAARATMAVFTAALSLETKWYLPVLAPNLFESLQVVWARRHMSADIKSIAFEPCLKIGVQS